MYNVTVYANDSLTNREHTLTLEATPGPYAASTVLFDYLEYTFDNDSQSSSKPPTSPQSHAGVIAGGVIGALAGLALIFSAVVHFLSCRRNNIRSSEGVTAYNIFPAPDPGLHTTSERGTAGLTGKAALHQEEVDRLQRSIGIPHRQSIATSTASASIAGPMTPAARGGNTESELAHQIAELRMEVADLRMRPSVVDDLDNFPPPQYDHHGSDMR